ncbi:MAG: tRNA preQ1(34) S-adenosylmethionine ribosyltransferase-isomerase QueA [Candidatus Moraniibacteriota bacterium]
MIDLEEYDYELPEALIRKVGVEPRDSSRLFVYDMATDTITHTRFSELAKYLPEQSVMVLNATKVVPARLWLRKPTGGKIEVFVLANEMNSPLSWAEEREGVRLNTDAIKPGSRIKCGMTNSEIPILVDRKCEVGWQLTFPNGDYLEVTRQEENKFFAKLHSFSTQPHPSPLLRKGEGEQALMKLLDQYGETPIPHYLEDKQEIAGQAKDEREQQLRKRYQTIFARSGASVAAPTASLHFTQEVFNSLDAKQIERVEVTLNVGLGTFAPLREENFTTGKLHTEYIEVSKTTANIINEAKQSKQNIVAVGTTALRTIESVAQRGDGKMVAYEGKTDIFIYPPYQFQIADSLVTNFHLPKSSLMLLVDAFLQHKHAKRNIQALYQEAIREGYAFYSFGDSMLIL